MTMSETDFKNWCSESVKKFYSENRSDPSRLYKSEKFFLEKINLRKRSILDIGCACGGFYNIFKKLYHEINYTGIDVSPELVEAAKVTYPEADFQVSTPGRLEFESDKFDMVYSSGVFHLIESEWKNLFREAYRVSKDKVLIDFRVTIKKECVGRIQLDFYGAGEKNYAVYTVLNIFDLMDYFHALSPKPLKISAYGYMNKPSPMADIKIDEICMAFFLIEKGSGKNSKTAYNIELPFAGIEKSIRERYL